MIAYRVRVEVVEEHTGRDGDTVYVELASVETTRSDHDGREVRRGELLGLIGDASHAAGRLVQDRVP